MYILRINNLSYEQYCNHHRKKTKKIVVLSIIIVNIAILIAVHVRNSLSCASVLSLCKCVCARTVYTIVMLASVPSLCLCDLYHFDECVCVCLCVGRHTIYTLTTHKVSERAFHKHTFAHTNSHAIFVFIPSENYCWVAHTHVRSLQLAWLKTWPKNIKRSVPAPNAKIVKQISEIWLQK